MTAIDHIGTLKDELPELFKDKDRELIDWPDTYDIVPIKNPTSYGNRENIEGFEVDFGGLRNDRIGEIIRGGHAGAPVPFDITTGAPPIDALAFYLPFHYYYPEWWGIYIKYEGLLWLSREIWLRTKKRVPPNAIVFAARLFLYYHEAFHHKTECFATRLEVTHRTPCYKRGFESYYQNTLTTPPNRCLEEALANATALKETKKIFKKVGLPDTEKVCKALCEIVKTCPSGYSGGADYADDQEAFEKAKWEFSEESHDECFKPSLPRKSSAIWATATHMFDPIATIKSRVNYIIPHRSYLRGRVPMNGGRLFMSSLKIRKQLKKITDGLKKVEGRTGRHPTYETGNGIKISIPEHSRDIGKGLVRTIIKQAGLDMTLREFQNY